MVPKESYRDLGYAVFSPQAFYERWIEKLYTIKSSDYAKLDSYQKAFIPNPFIIKS